MGCFGGDDEEVWISKQQVTLVKFRLKKEPKKETFPKATKFVIQKNEALDVPEDKYIQYKALGRNVNGTAKGFIGYATKYYFYKQGSEKEDSIVQFPWYFGSMSRQECKEILLNDNELNGDGAFFIRTGRKSYVLSIKYCDTENNNVFVSKNYQIHHNQQHKKFYIEKDRQYFTLNDLIESYKQKHETKLKTNLSGICLIPNPDVNKDFKDSLNIHYENDAWSIPRQEIEIEKEIGRGNFGVVSIGKLRGTTAVAVKTLIEKKDISNYNEEKFKKEQDNFAKENEIMKKLNHTNLVKMYGICVQEPPFMLILEFCEKGSLLSHLESFVSNRDKRNAHKLVRDNERLKRDCPNFEALKDWCEQIVAGMIYLESKGLIHRDLAARNILLNQFDRAKIADFGLAAEMEEEGKEDAVIPWLWSAPEIVTAKNRKERKFSHKSDVWSFGITMWEIFSFGENPYSEYNIRPPKKVKELLQENKTMTKPQKYLTKTDENWKIEHVFDSIITRCWNFKPELRPSFDTLLSMLQNQDSDFNASMYSQY